MAAVCYKILPVFFHDKNMNRILVSLASLVFLGAAGAQAQDAKPNLAMCIGCHGIPGYKTAYPDVYHVPKIAGQNPAYIVAALKAYKSGERAHPSMRGIALSLSEAQMQQYADYYGGGKK
jgi:cytochrome c553